MCIFSAVPLLRSQLTGFSPLYVGTQYAWYTVKSPAPSYKDIYRKFYTPHRIAQIVISIAQEGSVMTYSEFEDLYVGRWDHLLGDLIEWTDIVRSVRPVAMFPKAG